MIQLDFKSRIPIYKQVVDNMKRLIISGAMKPETRVPSVRELAQTLTCNPNTIQKAYRELETAGYFYTVPGQGSFIAKPPEQAERDGKITELTEQFARIAKELEFLGLSREDIFALIFPEKRRQNNDPITGTVEEL